MGPSSGVRRSREYSMRKRMTRAFSLVELMIVVAMIAILVAMLMPIIHAAWDAAFTAQCQTNLNRMWQAINMRRAATGETGFVTGGSWSAYLSPYVNSRVFHCPLGAERDIGGGAGGDSVGYGGTGGTGSSGDGSGSAETAVDNRYTESDLTFRMFARLDWSVYKAGQFLGTAFADTDYAHGVDKKDLGDGSFQYGIDDRLFFLDQAISSVDYKDIQFKLWLDGNKINKMVFVDSDKGSGSSYEKFRFEVYLGEEKVSDDFAGQLGTTIDFSADAATFAAATANAAGDQTLTDQLFSMIALMPAKSFDYGLNKGTYDRDGARVSGVDPRMPLILDYGKSVVDYESAKRDVWPMYFTEDEQKWMDVYHSLLRPGESWLKYAALRHGGRANVLFCDGHIEPLGADELSEDNEALWQRSGK